VPALLPIVQIKCSI